MPDRREGPTDAEMARTILDAEPDPDTFLGRLAMQFEEAREYEALDYLAKTRLQFRRKDDTQGGE